MQVNNTKLNLNPSFKAIRLSKKEFSEARDTAFFLKKFGFCPLGYKTIFADNTLKGKIDAVFPIRRIGFDKKDFGIVLLPWSKETYLLANPADEQAMLPFVKKIDKGAKINLSI